jgi:hypothetical protein
MMDNIDTSSGVLHPYYDDDTNMVYVAGKVSCFSSCTEFPQSLKVFVSNHSLLMFSLCREMATFVTLKL